ncbi:hypothetical protein QBC32DRAFT_346829, partial [Pseudoneurospora amorphoporcata]
MKGMRITRDASSSSSSESEGEEKSGEASYRSVRETSAQKRNRENDPNRTPIKQNEVVDLVSVRYKRKPRQQGGGDGNATSSLGESIVSAAAMLAALPGTTALQTAVKDIQKRFTGKVTAVEMMKCIDFLQKDPSWAMVYNGCGDEIKWLYVNRWI